MRWRPVRIRSRRSGAPAGDAPMTACQAPSTSMYLDQRGNVRACCQNDLNVLGNITERSLSEIWNGQVTASLRRALEADDYSEGCDFCAWQVGEGRPDLAFARWFDDLPRTEADPAWPRQLELSISNTCNLQCVMCNGEWSSSIRSQREGLAPLPKVYDDAFFEELRAFIPHLRRVKFLGGEPFLAAETLRVMELMVELGVTPVCHVTTNGTQWSPRVERILDLLPVDVAVSVDAATPELYEATRVGATWEGLQRNLDRFQERAATRGTQVSLTYCMMTSNWHELAAFCAEGDRRDVDTTVNLVTQPDHLTLYQLAPDRLAEVVEGLEAQLEGEAASLGRNRGTFVAEVDRLRRHLDVRREGKLVTGLDVRSGSAPSAFEESDKGRRLEHLDELVAARAELQTVAVGPGADRLDVDRSGAVTAVGPGSSVLGVPATDLVGKGVADLLGLFAERYGEMDRVDTVSQSEAGHVMEAAFPDGRVARVLSTDALGDDGSVSGTRVYVRWADEVPAPAER